MTFYDKIYKQLFSEFLISGNPATQTFKTLQERIGFNKFEIN